MAPTHSVYKTDKLGAYLKFVLDFDTFEILTTLTLISGSCIVGLKLAMQSLASDKSGFAEELALLVSLQALITGLICALVITAVCRNPRKRYADDDRWSKGFDSCDGWVVLLKNLSTVVFCIALIVAQFANNIDELYVSLLTLQMASMLSCTNIVGYRYLVFFDRIFHGITTNI